MLGHTLLVSWYCLHHHCTTSKPLNHSAQCIQPKSAVPGHILIFLLGTVYVITAPPPSSSTTQHSAYNQINTVLGHTLIFFLGTVYIITAPPPNSSTTHRTVRTIIKILSCDFFPYRSNISQPFDHSASSAYNQINTVRHNTVRQK